MGKQGKGRRLTDKERLEIIALTRQNPRIKHVELAAKYNVNESTIRKWRAQGNAAKIEERYAHGVAASRDGRQRGQAVRNAQFDTELYEWVAGAMKQDADLAPARVREKARALATEYDGMEGFKASSGWFYRFCRRYGLPCGPAGRETTSATSKLHDDMTIAVMIPMDVSAHNEHVGALMQQASGATHATLVPSQSQTTLTQHQDVDMETSNDAAAIALSLQPPTPAPLASAEPTLSEVAAATTAPEATDLEEKAPAPAVETVVAAPAAAPSDLLLGLGEMASVPASATAVVPTVSAVTDVATTSALDAVAATAPADPATTTATAAPSTAAPQAFSMAQAAATHMVHHFKDVLDPQMRLKLVRHFTRVAGEAEMYLVMDDETRLEYVKEFVAASSAAVTSQASTSSSVV